MNPILDRHLLNFDAPLSILSPQNLETTPCTHSIALVSFVDLPSNRSSGIYDDIDV